MSLLKSADSLPQSGSQAQGSRCEKIPRGAGTSTNKAATRKGSELWSATQRNEMKAGAMDKKGLPIEMNMRCAV